MSKSLKAIMRPQCRQGDRVLFHHMGGLFGGRIVEKLLASLGAFLHCPATPWLTQTVVSERQRRSRTAPASPGGGGPRLPAMGRSLGLIKELKVQADHNLSRGDLVQQETLGHRTLGALVLLDVSHTDLRPTQEI